MQLQTAPTGSALQQQSEVVHVSTALEPVLLEPFLLVGRRKAAGNTRLRRPAVQDQRLPAASARTCTACPQPPSPCRVASAGCYAHPSRRQQYVAEQQGGRELHRLRCVSPDEEECLRLVPAVAAISCQHSLGQLMVLVHHRLQQEGQSLLELC